MIPCTVDPVLVHVQVDTATQHVTAIEAFAIGRPMIGKGDRVMVVTGCPWHVRSIRNTKTIEIRSQTCAFANTPRGQNVIDRVGITVIARSTWHIRSVNDAEAIYLLGMSLSVYARNNDKAQDGSGKQ